MKWNPYSLSKDIRHFLSLFISLSYLLFISAWKCSKIFSIFYKNTITFFTYEWFSFDITEFTLKNLHLSCPDSDYVTTFYDSLNLNQHCWSHYGYNSFDKLSFVCFSLKVYMQMKGFWVLSYLFVYNTILRTHFFLNNKAINLHTVTLFRSWSVCDLLTLKHWRRPIRRDILCSGQVW